MKITTKNEVIFCTLATAYIYIFFGNKAYLKKLDKKTVRYLAIWMAPLERKVN